MEKKTIGGFIAALRKANGMTQKELAEHLHVSDKTVSRWERDEGTPDLSLIPVIAEIFGVNCDELLRGERRSPAERAESTEDAEISLKAEKQRRHLLKATLSQYRNHSCIAMGVSAAGLIAALICNLAFLKALLGFLVGAIFFVAALVCQAVFVNKACLRVEDAELDAAVYADFKRKVISLAEKSVGLTAAFVGFTSPLVLVDAFLGLGADSLLLWGSVGAGVFLLLYAVALYFFNAALLKRGTYTLSEKEAAVYHHNHRLKRICAILLICLLLVTFVGHEMATELWGPGSIMEGKTFHDYESFVAYMEQDVPRSTHSYGNSAPSNSIAVAPAPDGEIHYFDENGNEISEEQARRRELKDKNGNVVCVYTDRNENVSSLRYNPQDGTVLPITVCTYDDLQAARVKVAQRNVIFGAAYCLETALVLAFYFLKRAKPVR